MVFAVNSMNSPFKLKETDTSSTHENNLFLVFFKAMSEAEAAFFRRQIFFTLGGDL